jgi:6-pyruvoyltetrahydropterin/6-carboxytetrahydropterin synthase
MFTIAVQARFNASHSVLVGAGPREAPHGHDWAVEAEVGAERLDANGLVIDFHRLERLLTESLTEFDGALLDELPDFADANPTAENVARTIFGKLEARLPQGRCTLRRITVWETPTCSASYSTS